MSESRRQGLLRGIDMERLDYSAQSAHKGQQVTTGLAFRLESAAMGTAAIAFAVWHYADMIRAIVALF